MNEPFKDWSKLITLSLELFSKILRKINYKTKYVSGLIIG